MASLQTVYNSLPPGNYTFKARCTNGNGVYSNAVELKFKVKAPFWRTW